MGIEQPVWKPNDSVSVGSHMARFAAGIEAAEGCAVDDYAELYSWSIANPGQFWSEVARYTDIKFTQPATMVFKQTGDMQTARWFEGARLNFAANLLADPDTSKAIVFHDERGNRRDLSRAELALQVAALAAGMRQVGIIPGDRVAAILPNCPEAVIAMLAAASVGAVFSSCSPDFGVPAITDRFGQLAPRLLFVCDGYSYAGKRIDTLAKAAAVAAEMPLLDSVIVVPFLDAAPDISGINAAQLLSSFCIEGSAPHYASLPFDHQLYIVFSSGTTGKPKSIVHGAGGTLLQHKKELMLHTDVHAGEVIFYFTTCGWMMWNWLVSALAVKATVMLYDGSPFYPASDALLCLAEEEGVSIFGTSPKFLTELQKGKQAVVGNSAPQGLPHSLPKGLPTVRSLLSTGAPLAAETYDYIQARFGEHIQVSSISGGTDLISCFALGNPLLPVYRGELQCRGLGMAVEVFNTSGQSVTGEVGELVCSQAFPSMPIRFWNDNGDAYHAAYFARFPGVWAHGDLAEVTRHGGLKIYGRSDAVLNPDGIRIGSAEICGPAMAIDEVVDAIAVSQQIEDAERIILFVVLRQGIKIDAALKKIISATIRQQASPRHVPAKIIDVPEIPHTISGKPMELAVKAVIHGQPVANLSSIANPQALDYFRDRL